MGAPSGGIGNASRVWGTVSFTALGLPGTVSN